MKKLVSLMYLICWGCLSAQTCLPDGIEFEYQSQIDNFKTDYPGCTVILGDVTINDAIDNNITNLNGLDGIQSIAGDLRILENIQLGNLAGFDALLSVGDDLLIRDNLFLTSLSGLESLSQVEGTLEISDNPSLTTITSLSSLWSVGGTLDINYCTSLNSLNGLNNIRTVGGYLTISQNPRILNFYGLSSLLQIGGEFHISYNADLVSLEGLSNDLYFTKTLIIQGNANLSICHVKSICRYLSAFSNSYFSNNEIGCNTREEVLNLCTLVGTNELILTDNFSFPNPTNGHIFFKDFSSSCSTLTCKLYNQQGIFQLKKEFDLKRESSLDISSQLAGIYTMTLECGNAVKVFKIVKL